MNAERSLKIGDGMNFGGKGKRSKGQKTALREDGLLCGAGRLCWAWMGGRRVALRKPPKREKGIGKREERKPGDEG